jgi:hypothetical protein
MHNVYRPAKINKTEGVEKSRKSMRRKSEAHAKQLASFDKRSKMQSSSLDKRCAAHSTM